MAFPLITFTYASHVIRRSGMGAYSFSKSIVDYFVLFAGLGISTYATREGAKVRDDQKKINDLSSQLFSINIFSMLISLMLLFVLCIFVPRLNSYKELVGILSGAIILSTIGVEWINNIFEDYLYIAIRYVVIQAVALVLLFFLVRGPEDVVWYALITVIATYGGNLVNIFYVRKYVKIKFTLKVDFHKHIVPILILFATSIASIIYLNADITMLGILKNNDAVGIYTVSSKVYSMLKTVFNAVIMIVVPRFSYYLSNGQSKEYKEKMKSIVEILFVFSFPMIIGVIFETKGVLLIIGGSEYLGGSISLIILMIASLFAIPNCLIAYGYLIPNNKERIYLYGTIIAAVLNFALNFIAIPLLGINGAALTTFLAEFVMMIFMRKFIAEKGLFNLTKRMTVPVLFGVIIESILCICVGLFNLNAVLKLIISVLVVVPLYFIILLIFKEPFVIDTVRSFKERYKK